MEITEGEGGEALVSVLDRGSGVAPENRGRVFERFFQEEDALHHSKPGMGMGLYIAREIVRAHRGRIWAESDAQNKTNIFHVMLPLKK
jgi:signal transduction histidine kinase